MGGLSTAVALAKAICGASLTLGNGLEVLLEPREGVPWTVVVVGYAAGSRDEPRDRPQLAHLAELVSSDAANRSFEGDVVEELSRLGGSFRSITKSESTLYIHEGPQRVLPRVLRLEAHRMGNPATGIDLAVFDLKRATVFREFEPRLRRLRLDVERLEGEEALGLGHPLNPPRRSRLAEIPKHSPKEVRWFLDTYYRPGLASLVVIGGFDLETVRQQVEAAFGPLRASTSKVRRRSGPRQPWRRTAGLTLWHLGLADGYRTLWALPEARRWGPRAVLAQVLEDRLDERGLGAFFDRRRLELLGYRDATLLRFRGTLRRDQEPEIAEAKVELSLATALSEPVTDGQLAAARSRLRLEENLRAADIEAWGIAAAEALLAGEPSTLAARRQALREVTNAEVERLAQAIRKARQVRTQLRYDEARFFEVKVRQWRP
ncbi:MAG: insulinase family protein [Myxococcota bacterium]